jgi:hypothetical protein
MKSNIPMLILLATTAAGIAAEPEWPRFQQVAEFLEWADENLAADDYDALINAQANAKDKRPTILAYIKKLDLELGETKITKIFEGREFPKDATKFKLGGCCMELKHCHIDFEKAGYGWQVARIYYCR